MSQLVHRVPRHVRSAPRDGQPDSGSVVLLAPVVGLIGVVMACLLLDLAYLYNTLESLQSEVEVAATAAAQAISTASFYQTSTLRLDPAKAAQIARAQLSQFPKSTYTIAAIKVATSAQAVCVHATANVKMPAFGFLGRALLGNSVNARSVSELPAVPSRSAIAPYPWC